MLLFARRPGEEILIGDNIRIVVLSIRDGKVRIGIEAPRDVNVVRSELLTEVDELSDRLEIVVEDLEDQ